MPFALTANVKDVKIVKIYQSYRLPDTKYALTDFTLCAVHVWNSNENQR